MIRYLTLSLLVSAPIWTIDTTVEILEDLSHLPLLTPDLQERKTEKIRLQNGLEILLISDPGADQSAATVSVGSGSWSDPREYPGMAHFCEHMLFMGTQKYPDTNEFSAKIADFDGTTNAFTAPDRTVYMFSSRTEGFLSLLDRFAHFFIDPLFNPSNLAREMHAVDQEFALQKENDGWREYMVFKEMGNPNHPNALFSTGNSETLSKIPPNALKQWHKTHYRADAMRAAIYSSLPMDALKAAAIEAFQKVPQGTLDPSLPTHFSASLTSEKQKGQLISIQPIHHRQAVSLTWELPDHLSSDDSKSAQLIAYALQRGQPYSLYERLKNEQLIDQIRIDVDEHGGKGHVLFEINLELSKKGVEKIETVIENVFQALASLKQGSVPEYLFHERNQIAQLNYQYQSRTEAFQYISSIGRALADEDLSSYPRKSLLGSHYDPKKIEEILSFLNPEQSFLSLLAPQEIPHDRQEKWLKVPYSVRPIPPSWVKLWKEAKPNPDIRIPEKNPFLPTDLSLVEEKNPSAIPIPIAQSKFGKAYYIRCSEYQIPKAAIHLDILSPEINGSARSQVLTSLYLDHLTDQISPTLRAAGNTGLSSRFALNEQKLHIEVFGFSEKAPLLLQEILQKMPVCPLTKEQFDLYFKRHEKAYANGAKELAARQAKDLLNAFISPSNATKKEKLAALQEIEYEDLLSFQKKLFEKSYFEALFAGNLSLKTAESSWIDILHTLSKSPYPDQEHPETRTLHLPNEEGPFVVREATEAQGNATLLLIDQGDFTFERRAAQEILSSALHEAFFDTLRTKQKTGYIAQSQDAESERRLYQYFLVQSNSHHPEDLLHRFELFLEDYLQEFGTLIPEKRFEILRESAISSLKTRYRNLYDKSALWKMLAFEEKGDFSFIEKRIQGLEELSYETFTQLSQEFLSRANRKRLAILFEGKLHDPFIYTPITRPQLSEIANYSTRRSDERILPSQ